MEAQQSEVKVNKETQYKYPEHTKPLENQVAGHSFSDGCFTIGMLKDDEGFVLKPVNKPEQGRREIQFYESISSSTEPGLLQLKQFVPEYFGCVTLTVNGRSAQFLKLMDATRGYQKPCVMDVKIGRQTWEPGAPVKKQVREETKYTICKQQCGFCIPGFQVYNTSTGAVEKYGKDYGKKLTREDIPRVLKKFLNSESGRSRSVAEEMLNLLNNILSWWRSQREVHIYSSSVLLTYDAEALNEQTYCTVNKLLTTQVRVILIDFAHVLPANGSQDLNYLSGLENFVQIFMSVLNEL